MRFVARPPRAALAPFVGALWYFEGPDLPHARERVLPTGAMQLLVNLDEDALWCADEEREHAHKGAALGGPRHGPLVIDTRNQRRIAGVAFRPGGAAAFVRDRVDALSDAFVSVDVLWADGRWLRERLLEAGEPAAILDTLDGALFAQLARGPSRTITFAIDALEQGRRVRDVARELGWSGKLLHRRFGEAVGLTPKRYARVRRMQRVLRAVSSGRPVRWAELAATHGFSDQAHLVREFRALTGSTPGAYAPRSADAHNHIVLE